MEKIRTALRTSVMGSKNSLASQTSLSIGTCNNLLKDMLATGEVIEIEHAQSTGGRRSRQFRYNENYAQVMSMYLRKENDQVNIYYQVTNLLGEILESNHMSPDYLSIIELKDLIYQIQQTYHNLRVVSIGVPGVVQEGKIDICDIKSFVGFPMKNYLEELFGLEVVVENDVNVSAIGYYQQHGLEDESFAYIYYPINGQPGTGIVVHDEILKGHSYFAGEVSFLPYDKKESIIDQVIFAVQCMTCIINPNYLVLSGLGFKETDFEAIEISLHNRLNNQHLPKLIYEADFHESYVYGLVALAIETFYKNI